MEDVVIPAPTWNDEIAYGRMRANGVVPIVTISNRSQAAPLGEALAAGGITTVEITLRSDAAFDAIEEVAGRAELSVGVGTVVNSAQVDEAFARGADFIVSPGFSPSVVARSIELGLWAVPGVATASEVQLAVSLGVQRLKLFPAEVLGGVALLSALEGPFAGVEFMPSGGINLTNLREYLCFPTVFAVGCSWIASPKMLAESDFDSIATAARIAISTAARN